MRQLEAKLTLSEIVPAEQWVAFTDWLEQAKEPCDHDEASFEPWLVAQRLDTSDAARLYAAMGSLAAGPCRCAAAVETWPADFHGSIRGPLVFCRPQNLPRALTGVPAAGREAQLGWFFAAHRGDTGGFWEEVAEPEAHAEWDDALDLLGLLCELVASDRELAWAAVDSRNEVDGFYHGGDPDEVERWLRERGHTLLPLAGVLERLAVVVLEKEGQPVTDVRLDGTPAVFYEPRPEVVVVRVSERTMWAEGWRGLPEGQVRFETSAGPVVLPEPLTPGVHVVSVP